MQLPYTDVLDIAHFSRLFDNKSECYKLFWFQAIARKIKEGYEIITFEALIDEMIADAIAQLGKGAGVRGETLTLEEFARLSNDIQTRQKG